MKQIYHQQVRQKFGKDRRIKDATNTAHLKVLIVHVCSLIQFQVEKNYLKPAV